MEKIKGFEEAKVISAKETLPKGGYKLKVMDAEEVKTDRAHYIKISFDIDDGIYIDFYKKDYLNQQSEDKKWKGFINVFVPKENDTYYEQNLSRFKTIISDFESSNNGFHWDWDESKLKELHIGGVFGAKEWQYNGMTGFNTECRFLTSIETIEKGKFKIPADKLLNGSSAPTPTANDEKAFEIDGDEDDLPF